MTEIGNNFIIQKIWPFPFRWRQQNRATTAADLTHSTGDGSRIGEGPVVEHIIVSELGALL